MASNRAPWCLVILVQERQVEPQVVIDSRPDGLQRPVGMGRHLARQSLKKKKRRRSPTSSHSRVPGGR